MATQFTSSCSHHHHHHGLSLTSCQSRYKCGGCLMDVRPRHGERYRCTDSCDFDLHKECLNPNPIRSLDIFPDPAGNILKFLNRPPTTAGIFKFLDRPPPAGPSETCCLTTYCGSCRACNVCGLTVKGFVYHCAATKLGKTGLDLHPLCASLDKEIRVDGVKFKLREGVPYSKCTWCNRERLQGSVKNVPGFCYVASGSQGCSFHVACLMEMGIKYGTMAVADHSPVSRNDVVDDVDINRLGQQLVMAKNKCNDNIVKFGRVVGLFLKVVLSVIFGDPTAIFAAMVVHLLKS